MILAICKYCYLGGRSAAIREASGSIWSAAGGREFVIGGFTSGSNAVGALIVGYFERRKLIYTARVRSGLVPVSRRELHYRLKPLIVKTCPFVNLPEATSGRWGQGSAI